MADSQLVLVFAYKRWLFSCGIAFLFYARGDILFYSDCKSLLSASYVPNIK